MSEETHCRVCGRRLTVRVSVEREIGPVCWGRLKRGEITVSILLPAKTFPKKEKA